MNSIFAAAAASESPSFMDTILNSLYGFVTTVGFRLIGGLIVLIVGFALTKLVVKKIRKSKKMDAMLARFLASFANFGGKILTVIIAISILGVEMSSIVALIASAGVAIGLALQGSLSNIAGGILLVIFKPFHVGDYIKVAGEEGTVNDMNLFYTVLKTGANVTISLPNATVSNSALENLSVEATRRVDFTISVAYGTDVERVKKLLLAIAANHELVLEDPAPFCRLSAFNESSLDFTFRVWVKSGDYWTVNFDINEAIDKAFKLSGIEIPFPQLDVHVNNVLPKEE